jgi:fatty acid-binding protein DegV
MEETEGKDVETFIIHAGNQETAEYMKKRVKELKPNVGEINDYLLTPAVGAHGGPGAITIGYILNK